MVNVKDPTRDAIIRELRVFRRGAGQPAPMRLTGLFHLTEALGNGAPGRAFEEITRLYEAHGRDPRTAIGAFFYLSGWGVGLDSVEQRRWEYQRSYFADISTAWRRSEKGIRDLATIIRDRDEQSRPWAVVSLFQSGNSFQPFLDFNLGFESLQKPIVLVNEERVALDIHFHEDPRTKLRYTSRVIMNEVPLDLSVRFGEPMANLRVLWNMPVWPVWRVMSWTADPRIMTVLRTFRERAVEVSLQWWRDTTPAELDGLVRDGGIWTERSDPRGMVLPEGWGLGKPDFRDGR